MRFYAIRVLAQPGSENSHYLWTVDGPVRPGVVFWNSSHGHESAMRLAAFYNRILDVPIEETTDFLVVDHLVIGNKGVQRRAYRVEGPVKIDLEFSISPDSWVDLLNWVLSMRHSIN